MTRGTFNSRDAAIAVLSALTAAAIALLTRLPGDVEASDLLAIVGTFLGAAIAIGGSLIVVSRQADQNRSRHHETANVLLEDLVERAWVLDQILKGAEPPESVTERIRPLVASAAFSLRAASTALDRLRVESPALAQIAQVGDVWIKTAAEIEELVRYVSPELVFEAVEKLNAAAEHAQKCRNRLTGGPFASGKARRLAEEQARHAVTPVMTADDDANRQPDSPPR